MSHRRVTATELARNLSSMLNEVRYRELTLEVWRGRDMVAQVVPPIQPAGVPIEQINALFAALPRLGEDDADTFLEDLGSIDNLFETSTDPWAS
jgi:hypothetical protein